LTELVPSLENFELAERGGFEQSEPNPQAADLHSARLNTDTSTSQTASQKPVPNCPELSELSQAWPKLPADAQTAILVLIRAVLKNAK
jgi:hypothetical protein